MMDNDEGLHVLEAVRKINTAWAGSSVAIALTVGDIVEQLVRHRAPERVPISVRQLAHHPALRVSPSSITRAVAVHALWRELSLDEVVHLGVSHLYEISVAPADTRRALVQRAEAERWTVVRTRRAVRCLVDDLDVRARGGRRRLPRFVKAVQTLRRVSADELTADLERAGDLSPTEVRGLLASLSDVRRGCEELQRQLRARVPYRELPPRP